jgi:hypothetical protein
MIEPLSTPPPATLDNRLGTVGGELGDDEIGLPSPGVPTQLLAIWENSGDRQDF